MRRLDLLHPLRRFALLLMSAAIAFGCEPGPTPSAFGDRGSDAVSADTRMGSDTVAAVDPFNGAWALATDWSVCVTVGDRVETRSRKLLLVEMTHKGYRILERRRLCQLQLTPIFGLKTVVPDVVLQSVPPLEVESRVLGAGSGELAYAGGIEAQLMGVTLINPVYDAMPTKGPPLDPRITDPESDGHPGVTFHVGTSCDLYVAQREVSRLDGRLVSPGRFEGAAVHATEQVVFGSSKALCGQTFKTFSNTPHHRFVLQRIDVAAWDDDKSGAVDCAELIAHQSELVTWAQPDDARCPNE